MVAQEGLPAHASAIMKHSSNWYKVTLETYQKKIEDLQELQRQVCLECIEQEAQKILTAYPELTVYCQGMGSWSFFDMWNHVVEEVDGVDLEHDTMIASLHETYHDLQVAGVPLKITKNLQTGEFSKDTDWISWLSHGM